VIRVPFYPNTNVGQYQEEIKYIFKLSSDYIYVICSDGCEFPYDDELILHKIEYYLNPDEFYQINRSINLSFFPKDYKPNMDRLFSSNFYEKYKIPDDYTVFRVNDSTTLNFLLTTNNDERMHIFSSDYDISFLSTYLDEYYQNISQYRSITKYEYIYKKYADYIQSKKFIFYDTYADDEDTNYLFSGNNITLFEKMIKLFTHHKNPTPTPK